MKKLLGIVVLSLLWCNTSFAADKVKIFKGYLKETSEEVKVLKKAIYSSYLDSCSGSNTKYYSLEIITPEYAESWNADISEVEVFEATNLNINCLETKFEHHQKNYPVISFASDNPMPPQKILKNKETLNLNAGDMPFDKIEISSLFSQKCGESCSYSKETILINKNKYWFIKGSNDKGIEAEFSEKDKISIVNLMSTHKRKYIFDINEKTINRKK